MKQQTYPKLLIYKVILRSTGNTGIINQKVDPLSGSDSTKTFPP